jgi:isomerase DpgB
LRIGGDGPILVETIESIQALCDRAESGDGPGLTIIRVAGVPGPDWTRGLTATGLTRWERTLRRLERLPAPTAAVVSGDCGGPALDALLVADVRIATSDARLLLARASGAVWPGMALYRLATRTGTSAVRRAALLGTPVDAAEAYAAGLVDEVVEDPDVALVALERSVAGLDGQELAIRRQLLRDASRRSFEEALGPHLAACDRALRRGVGS